MGGRRGRWLNTWLFKGERTPFVGADPIDCAGKFSGSCSGQLESATPDFRVTTSATWRSGPAMLRLQGRYVGGLDRIEGGGGHVESVSGQAYFDLNGRYMIGETIELYAGIKNLLDNEPPIMGVLIAGDANVEVSLYDTIGRRFFAGASVRF